MLGGVTRMTVSLVVILFELTGALSHVLPIMVGVMSAKWVGDALGEDGIYNVWIAMRQYPFIPPVDYNLNDRGRTAADAMRPFGTLVKIQEGHSTLKDIENLTSKYDFHGFPVVRGRDLIGYATRNKLLSFKFLGLHLSADTSKKKCRFSSLKQKTPFSTSEKKYLKL
ncbi:hypothetical protein DFH05DRAFT_1487802 [Lentinula detonsa]|uniref:Chloride channel protein n=1 Tax=Lentinula detonsa TaxID=2804962 RepID=A0A9W8P1Z5_9AGAR|nr:hypothetical protein DFH05DRAFT_1487802 [Lentinula detonsa]